MAAHLEFWRQLPQPRERGDLHAKNDLQTLEVMIARPLSVVHCFPVSKLSLDVR